MFNGVALILAVSFAVWRQRSDARHTAAGDDAGSIGIPLSEEGELSTPGAGPTGTGDVSGSLSGDDNAPAAPRT
jgi:hypothetical protein